VNAKSFQYVGLATALLRLLTLPSYGPDLLPRNKVSLSESFLGLDDQRVELAMATVRWVASGEDPKSAVCDGEKMMKELAKTYPDEW